jgi:hypothetical protein
MELEASSEIEDRLSRILFGHWLWLFAPRGMQIWIRGSCHPTSSWGQIAVGLWVVEDFFPLSFLEAFISQTTERDDLSPQIAYGRVICSIGMECMHIWTYKDTHFKFICWFTIHLLTYIIIIIILYLSIYLYIYTILSQSNLV